MLPLYQTKIYFMKTSIQQPLTNLQLELLKLFAREVDDSDLIAIKKMVAAYFAAKAMDSADKIWQEKKWSLQDEQKFLSEHNRTPYKFKRD